VEITYALSGLGAEGQSESPTGHEPTPISGWWLNPDIGNAEIEGKSLLHPVDLVIKRGGSAIRVAATLGAVTRAHWQ